MPRLQLLPDEGRPLATSSLAWPLRGLKSGRFATVNFRLTFYSPLTYSTMKFMKLTSNIFYPEIHEVNS